MKPADCLDSLRRDYRDGEVSLHGDRCRLAKNCLRFFADRAAKKWPLRGSLKLG